MPPTLTSPAGPFTLIKKMSDIFVYVRTTGSGTALLKLCGIPLVGQTLYIEGGGSLHGSFTVLKISHIARDVKNPPEEHPLIKATHNYTELDAADHYIEIVVESQSSG